MKKIFFVSLLLISLGFSFELSALPPTYWQDTKPIFDAKCTQCHGQGKIMSSMPWETYNQIVSSRALIANAIATDTMPPWPPDNNVGMSYLHDRSLTDAQKQVLLTWLGDPNDPNNLPLLGDPLSPAPALPASDSGLSEIDLTLSMPAPGYTPQTTIDHPDEYRCFILDWAALQPQYVSGLRVNPGQVSMVHHAIAYVLPPDLPPPAPSIQQGYLQLDANDPGLGYTCWGGPSNTDNFLDLSLLGTWTPGSLGHDYPTGTGIKIEPGSKIILQVHYNTANVVGNILADKSSIDLKLDPVVAKEAKIFFWANQGWIYGYQLMDIPAGVPDVVHSFSYNFSSALGVLSQSTFPAGATTLIHGANLHMHQKGSQASLFLTPNNNPAAKKYLLSIPQWNFHWQDSYFFEAPVLVSPGENLNIECHWNNAGSNETLFWGDKSTDEMCLGMVYVTVFECGDGTLDTAVGEVCDDGNTQSGDGCRSDCKKIEQCGDGFLDAGEMCDDGNQINGDSCTAQCLLPFCGNHILEPNESCDDGNNNNGDGCDFNCTLPECGNGVHDPDMGEACDDGNATEGDVCDSNCTLPACGNAIIDASQGEVCDDGNQQGGDGCSANCVHIEACGNGWLDAGEACDDGNTQSGDGCRSDCKKVEQCGDGIKDMGESCDDGNVLNEDGCNQKCKVEWNRIVWNKSIRGKILKQWVPPWEPVIRSVKEIVWKLKMILKPL